MSPLQEKSSDLLDVASRKKTQRSKRLARPDKDRAPPKNKRRKRGEEEERTLSSSPSSSSDPLMKHLTQVDQQHLLLSSFLLAPQKQTLRSCDVSSLIVTDCPQLSVLPLMEPVLGVDVSLFLPYGSSTLSRDSRLSGSFGNASLDGVTDFYSQLIYKVAPQCLYTSAGTV